MKIQNLEKKTLPILKKSVFVKNLNFNFFAELLPFKEFLYIFFANWISNPDHTVQARIFKFGIDVLWVAILKYFFHIFENLKKIKDGGQ